MLYNEEARRADAMTLGFLGTLLQDAQYSEDDAACEEDREARDTGTVYTCPDATFKAALDDVAAFRAAAGDELVAAAVDALGAEHIGSDLYLERAGHGAGFADRRELAGIAEALSAAVPGRSGLETYLGDDGACYVVGREDLPCSVS